MPRSTLCVNSPLMQSCQRNSKYRTQLKRNQIYTEDYFSSIIRYCKGLPDKDNFTKNTIVYLLSRSLRDTTKVADVKRVYAMHSALVSVNLQSSESENLRKLLLRTAKSSVYLKNNDGIKFVSFLVSLDSSIFSLAFVVPSSLCLSIVYSG